MKKYLIAMVAVLAVIAMAMPSFALELKYGGLFRVRLQSNDNVVDGQDGAFRDNLSPNGFLPGIPFSRIDPVTGIIDPASNDDNQNFIDQRLRMYFTFVASENLQVVTKWEADTIWGNETAGAGRHGGGDVGADATNLEMKNAYIDFAIPMTTARATLGVQGFSLMRGWVFDDDASAAIVTGKFDPIRAQVGYVAARNEDVTSSSDNVDDLFLSLEYAAGPLKAGFLGFYQKGSEFPPSGGQGVATTISTIDPGLVGHGTQSHGLGGAFNNRLGDATGLALGPTNNVLDFFDEIFGANTFGVATNAGLADNQKFFDLGLSLEYKLSWLSAYVNFVKNFGSWKRGAGLTNLIDGNGLRVRDLSNDFNGWMVDAGTNLYCGPWTFTVSGFVTSGGDIKDPDDFDRFFRYPEGASHYWSEILGLGVLDSSVGEAGDRDRNAFNLGYAAGDRPSNLWTIQAGAAYQLLKDTKLTLNYWYVGTVERAVSDASLFLRNGAIQLRDLQTDKSIGHEFDFYLDQKVVDGLNLKLVGAYLIAGDAYTIFPKDDDAYELGAVLQWSF